MKLKWTTIIWYRILIGYYTLRFMVDKSYSKPIDEDYQLPDDFRDWHDWRKF